MQNRLIFIFSYCKIIIAVCIFFVWFCPISFVFQLTITCSTSKNLRYNQREPKSVGFETVFFLFLTLRDRWIWSISHISPWYRRAESKSFSQFILFKWKGPTWSFFFEIEKLNKQTFPMPPVTSSRMSNDFYLTWLPLSIIESTINNPTSEIYLVTYQNVWLLQISKL